LDPFFGVKVATFIFGPWAFREISGQKRILVLLKNGRKNVFGPPQARFLPIF
jgi:hypothetical protein